VTTDQCIAANADAQSSRRSGKFTEARQRLAACLDSHCPRMVSTDCAQRLDELDRAQPTIVFDAKDPAGHDLIAVKVTVDGQRLTEKLDGTALPVDPGQHTFVFEAAGLPPVTQTFVAKEGEKARRISVQIGNPASPAAPTPVGAATAAEPPGTEQGPAGVEEGTRGPSTARRTAGLVIGGVGFAGLAAGAVFGFLAIGEKNDYLKNCGSNIGAPSGFCNSDGVAGHNDASTKATVSTVLFVGGGVVAAAGAVLFLTAPSGAARASVGVGPTGVFARGTF
jgi:hypothetical protein